MLTRVRHAFPDAEEGPLPLMGRDVHAGKACVAALVRGRRHRNDPGRGGWRGRGGGERRRGSAGCRAR